MAIETLSLRQNRDFVRLWTAQAISKFGSHVGHAGVEFTAILHLHATPIQMGLLGGFATFPVLVVGLLAGVWVDRARRRPLLIASDVGRALLLLTVPLALWLGFLRIEQLYLVVALIGALAVLFDVADQSALPGLVRREQLVEANSRMGTSDALAEVGGPALGGSLVQWLTAPVAIVLDAFSFLISAVLIRRIRTPETPPPPPEQRGGIRMEIREGLATVWSAPTLRALALANAATTFFGSFIGVLYALFLIRDLGLSPALVGASVGVGGVGALLGATLAAPITRRLGVGPAIVLCRLVSTVIGFLLPLAGGPKALAIGMIFFGQLTGDLPLSIAMINETSLRQAAIPHRLLGRAGASMDVLVRGVAPLGALVGGLLGETIGVRPTLYVAFVAILIANIGLFFSPVRAVRDLNSSAGA